MRKFNPPAYFKNIVAHRKFGYISIKMAAEILHTTHTTYLKYERMYYYTVTKEDMIPLSKIESMIKQAEAVQELAQI